MQSLAFEVKIVIKYTSPSALVPTSVHQDYKVWVLLSLLESY